MASLTSRTILSVLLLSLTIGVQQITAAAINTPILSQIFKPTTKANNAAFLERVVDTAENDGQTRIEGAGLQQIGKLRMTSTMNTTTTQKLHSLSWRANNDSKENVHYYYSLFRPNMNIHGGTYLTNSKKQTVESSTLMHHRKLEGNNNYHYEDYLNNLDSDQIEQIEMGMLLMIVILVVLCVLACLCCCCCCDGGGGGGGSSCLWDLLALFCCYELCCDNGGGVADGFCPMGDDGMMV